MKLINAIVNHFRRPFVVAKLEKEIKNIRRHARSDMVQYLAGYDAVANAKYTFPPRTLAW